MTAVTPPYPGARGIPGYVQVDPPHTNHSDRPDNRPMGPRSRGVPSKPSRASNLKGLTTQQIQKLLKARGYNVSVDGKMGPRTSTAINAYVKGKPPIQYNTWANRHFAPQPVAPHGAGAVGASAAGRAAGRAGAHAGSGAGGVAGLTGLDPEVGQFLPESLAGQEAGLQFDPQIHQTQRQLDAMPATRAQNLHDISSWYGQVLDSEGKAGTRDHEINAAGQGSVKDAVASIIASLGGGANQGSGVVGAAGADALGMLGAEGAAQEQYNSDLRPLLNSESAGASTRESARLAQQTRDLQGTLSDLTGQRGAARAAALLDIKDKNNALAQQNFQNEFGVQQMNQAGAIAAGKLLKGAKAPKGSYAGSSSTQKLGVFQTAVGSLTNEDGSLKYDVPRTVSLVNQLVAGAGWDRANPAVKSFRNSVLTALNITPQAGWS